MGTKKCSKCGITKTYDHFYVHKKNMEKYGIDNSKSYRNECKSCHAESSKKQRDARMSYSHGLYFIYFVYNHNDELIYIGKTNDVCERIRQHQKEKRFD